ncbi:FmdB family zinc ribbon protein [Dyella tabacisoli]|uniref:Zinc ribbon domain-containing protein n=1 Tax=Dyella tabacisoli TaxID=2282381 RepID=A0A369ULM2_9GAMM|nr:zinc ribbon domain-containing protein [Dyella tabacisoli]RDD80500.1 zinc ribbon domain-containing protein [Dyella tabacisoli]
MPIYEFECSGCGHRFDRLQKLSDPDPETCPQCAAPRVQRKLSAPSFRLAGSGWYETDFKKDGDKKRNLAGEAASPAPAAAAPAGDSKPAASSPAPAPTSSD